MSLYFVQLVVVMYVGLWLVDGFPVLLVITGVLTHLCYGSLLSTFPVISLLSPGFIAGTCTYSTVHSRCCLYSGSRHVYIRVVRQAKGLGQCVFKKEDSNVAISL